jgi:small subunit ribosomal protein S2
MALPTFTMRQLLEAGVHFGHNTRRWNPKMDQYLFGVRNGIHIIDLAQTVPLLHQAMVQIRDKVAAESAGKCGQYYVNHRWLGGMLTNWKTVSGSIKRLKELEAQLAGDMAGLTKKEQLNLTRECEKLERTLGGIKEMGGLPDVMVVFDTQKEAIAINEAKNLGIPVIAILDSNSSPLNITHPVPGNDDSIRALKLYCDLFAGSVLDGIQSQMSAAGIDVGAQEEAPVENLPEAEAEAPAAAEA